MATIPVIDLFAGPGGLNEGFCSLEGPGDAPVFSTSASIEMDATACQTLRLRSALRTLRHSTTSTKRYHSFLRGERTWSEFVDDAAISGALDHAGSEVHRLELGPDNRELAADIIRRALLSAGGGDAPWVLIGGPPCQAYSLVGRARRTNDVGFEDDVKHFLYREYLDIISVHRPPVFVMENVKGLISHTHRGQGMFSRILDDLGSAGEGYEIRSFVVDDDSSVLFTSGLAPSDYIIRSERYGVPQRRHRVILLGVRRDLAAVRSKTLRPSQAPSVFDAIGHLPRIRSRISPLREDDFGVWRSLRDQATRMAGSKRRRSVPTSTGWAFGGPAGIGPDSDLERWLSNGELGAIAQHQARAHMTGDLMRYAFLAAKAESGVTVKVGGLPAVLAPNHANAQREIIPFADRFRVQAWDRPSTTVTSHIAKDGHYYIHPDAAQMRSLTVREAARLQTFPDDYFFCGNRTQQYHQVGNAVPPFLARQLAEVVADFLGSPTQ